MRLVLTCSGAAWIVLVLTGSPALAQQIVGGQMRASVQELSDGSRLFTYVVSNDAASDTPIGMVDLFLECGTSPANEAPVVPTAPLGWAGALNQRAVTWTAVNQASEIAPATSRGGFSVRTTALPGLCTARLGPVLDVDNVNIPVPALESELPVYFAAVKRMQDGRSITVTTLGPIGVAPESSLAVRLVELEHSLAQAYAAGWFLNRGAWQSIVSILTAARRALERGNEQAAENDLNALLNHVGAQDGKQMSAEAAALIRGHVTFLLSTL